MNAIIEYVDYFTNHAICMLHSYIYILYAFSNHYAQNYTGILGLSQARRQGSACEPYIHADHGVHIPCTGAILYWLKGSAAGYTYVAINMRISKGDGYVCMQD